MPMIAMLVCLSAAASDLDEFKVKREQVFEFVEKPTVARSGDRVTIRFETKGFCDVTVAIEDTSTGAGAARIVRHLASGVLGPNAPEPFRKNAKAQTIVWDGKDDAGTYIDDKDRLTVRVSLGLDPHFERTLFWSPHKRTANACQLLAATPAGMLVYEGRGTDHIRLFDHDGDYLRTVYPFPANRLDRVRGLTWRTFQQDGQRLPVKLGFVQASLLTSGTSCLLGIPYKMGTGYAGIAMAVRDGRIALVYDRINRLAIDGTTGGLDLTGPAVGRRIRSRGYGGFGQGENIVGPQSVAFSPDGKTLYLTGFMWYEMYHHQNNAFHGVLKVDFERDAEPTLFAGQMATDAGAGTDNAHFRVPTSVACDSKGRVYVSDFMNDRIQVYDPTGRFLKSIRATRPAKVLVSPVTGEIWVFTWPVYGVSPRLMKVTNATFDWRKIKPTLIRYGPFEDPTPRSRRQVLPIGFYTGGFFVAAPMVDVAVDWYAESPRLWVAARKYNVSRIDVAWGGLGAYGRRGRDPWLDAGVRILGEHDGQWRLARAFAADAKKRVLRLKPPDFARQRLYVNPRTGRLSVGEDLGFGKSFKELIEIDPETGRVRLIDLPFDTEDLAFDLQGRAYLRTDTMVVRYDPDTWREIPWDYGEEHRNVGFSSLGGGYRTDVRSALRTPGQRPVCWHAGGMALSPTGYLVVACCSRAREKKRSWMDRYKAPTMKVYTPTLYPGRSRWGEVHVWDRYGRLVHADAIPGIRILNGVHLDRAGNLYVMAARSRVLDGTPYPNEMAGTLIKFKPRAGKVLSPSDRVAIPLPESDRPKRPTELKGFWVEGAEWFYGGVGFGGFNPAHSGGGCACWNSRFCLDSFARSFAPEIGHYSVAVLDTNGNLILRVGQYGNVDDGMPPVKAAGPPNPRPIGGDEVGLFYPAYLATHTDRRLFIADPGNARILSVTLDYHATERVRLKDVPGTKP